MAEAFILINTDVGAEFEVLSDLQKIDGVVDASMVYGTYDIIVKVRSSELSDLKERVIGQFRSISKIRNTMTLITVEN